MTIKVMVSFPDEFLAEVDRIARDEQRSRSELLREAMRVYIEVRRNAGLSGDDLGLSVEQVKEALADYRTHRDRVESETEQESRPGKKPKPMQVEIPEEWLQDLDRDQATMLQEIVQLGMYQLRIRRALEMYQAGAGSLGYVAEKTGLSKRDLVREARSRGIEPLFDEQTVREELGQ